LIDSVEVNKLVPRNNVQPGRDRDVETGLVEALRKAVDMLKPSSLCVLSRKPLMDEDCPEVPEIDILSIWSRMAEYPQRIVVSTSIGRVFVDVLWVPVSSLIDPFEAAGYRMLSPLLLESETVWTLPSFLGPLVDQIRAKAYEKAVWEKRLGSQLSFGDSALQEATRNLDFPAGALFFLQTAHAYYIIALADALQVSVTSIMTKPMTKLRRIDAMTSSTLVKVLMANNHLDKDPSHSIGALRRIHEAVSARCGSQRVPGMGERTWGHYEYSLSRIELEYREAVAAALTRKGEVANANFYLRFWAYSLSRCPVVCEEAKQGRKPSFYVPFGALKESLSVNCPEILEDVSLILGGEVTRGEAENSIKGTAYFRQLVVEKILGRGLTPVSIRKGAHYEFGESDH
jgi:hypothetical protein